MADLTNSYEISKKWLVLILKYRGHFKSWEIATFLQSAR